MAANYANLPKVDKLTLLLEREATEPLSAPLLAAAAREAVAALRARLAEGQLATADKEHLLQAGLTLTRQLYARKNGPSLKRVINATGIVLHTNLGRAVLAEEARDAIVQATGYCNLELDLASGKRSSRYEHVAELLSFLTGAEDALVVNNNAAAVLLALDTLGKGGEAVISRGELVEIGGSFRVPEVMAATGVTMVEVGCTNKTHVRDYEAAITERTSLLLKVHPSNFKLSGFCQSVELADLLALGHKHGLPVMYDLGGGCFYPLAEAGVGEEPQVAQIIGTGPDVLCFSGDKLLGGPQAGIILGKSEYIKRMKANPLTRALRIDKFTLAALEATLRLYLDMEAARKKIPTLAMILAGPEELREKAQTLAGLLSRGGLCEAELAPGVAEAGGGSLPAVELPGPLVLVKPGQGTAATLLESLRIGDPPILAYIREDKAVFDVRTLSREEITQVVVAVTRSLTI